MAHAGAPAPSSRVVSLGELATSNLSRLLAAPVQDEAQLLEAVACMKAIPRSYPVLVAVGAQRVSTVLRRARLVAGPVRAEAETLRRHLLCSHAQPKGATSAPEAPEEWISLLRNSHADVNELLPELRRLTASLKELGIEFPYQLGAREERQLAALRVVEEEGQRVLLQERPALLPKMWKLASTLRGQRVLASEPPMGADPGGLFALADRIHAEHRHRS